jgi:hypothetical protein
MDYNLKFSINERIHTFDVQSKSFNYGKVNNTFEYSLFTDSELLTNGYIIRAIPQDWHNNISNSITNFLCDKIIKHTGKYPDLFTLDSYHKYVDDTVHKKIVEEFRAGFFGVGGIPLSKLGIPYSDLDCFINEQIGGKELSCHYKRYGISLKNFWIRIVRPNTNDNNPPHKDVHVKRINKNINIYLPLAGSDMNSSLPVIPASHLESDSEYIISGSPCYVNGRKFTVPAIVHRRRGLDMITPNPSLGEVMIFTPHLIHGGGVNYNQDTTRVSLEMRFFK